LENSSVLETLRSQPQFSEQLRALSDRELEALVYDWDTWARPNQIAPKWDWATWLILAGRGYGKTRVGAEMVRGWIKQGFNRVNLLAPTADDIRDVMVEGESGILAICPADERPVYRVSKRRLEWPNGAISLLFTAEEPNRLRGKQSSKLWCDEPAAWRYDVDAWDQAQFGLRIGSNPQTVATTTPRPTKLVRSLVADSVGPDRTVAITRGTTYENRSNLAPGFYRKIITKYENTRLGRQELLAEILDDNPGALFHLNLIEAARVRKLPPLVRIVVAMDPATTSNEDSDEWGVIAVGQDGRDPAHFYVLADESGVLTPHDAVMRAVRLYHRLSADRLVGEANNGGDMIETIVRFLDANVAYRKVTASRGKLTRAEPVSALYEQGRVHHHGMHAVLEDQMTTWNPKVDDDSPDRMDALVWATTELASGMDGWMGFVKDQGRAAQADGTAEAPAALERVDVAGNNRDRCECGSTFWVRIAGIESCIKCQKPRPML
jgi:phage terminase large subunit-like protein